MKHSECHQTEIISEITKKLQTQKQLGEETFASLEDHREAQRVDKEERLHYRETREKHDLKITNELEVIKLALFGNEKLGMLGDHQLITEIHELLVKGSTIKQFFVWLFGTIVAILGAGYMIFKMFKDIR